MGNPEEGKEGGNRRREEGGPAGAAREDVGVMRRGREMERKIGKRGRKNRKKTTMVERNKAGQRGGGERRSERRGRREGPGDARENESEGE